MLIFATQHLGEIFMFFIKYFCSQVKKKLTTITQKGHQDRLLPHFEKFYPKFFSFRRIRVFFPTLSHFSKCSCQIL